jgi:transcriptional regulator with XRE-family HTH domain
MVDSTITIKVGNRIKELRRLKNLSQEKLALIAEIDRTYIAGVESGKRNISIRNLEKIIIALDTNFKNFFSTVGEE